MAQTCTLSVVEPLPSSPVSRDLYSSLERCLEPADLMRRPWGATGTDAPSSARRSTIIPSISPMGEHILARGTPARGAVGQQRRAVGVPHLVGGLDGDREGVGAEFAAHGTSIAPLS